MSAYYPIGTVVKTRIENTGCFMIAGYLPKRNEDELFDYFAVPFPMGLIDETSYICFNNDIITEVVHMGYCDNEGSELLGELDSLVKDIISSIKQKKSEQGQ